MTENPMKLTLRELFLLVVIAAMGCGWWVHVGGLLVEIGQLEHELAMTPDERLHHAKENEEEWREIHDRMLEAIEAEGYIAGWEHHSRTVRLEKRSP
jgi:hypothetical protein